VARRRRVIWHNALSTLPRYERLLAGVRSLDEPVTTTELQEFAGLDKDLNGTLGALFMLEAQGYLYPIRAQRRKYIWYPGERPGERPEKLPELLPLRRLPTLLQHFGRTPIGTVPIMKDIHFESEKHGRRERLLGSLKVLAALGIAAYDEERSGWYDARSNGLRRMYKPGLFGPREGLFMTVPYDDRLLKPGMMP
jgi:hypothetical protein